MCGRMELSGLQTFVAQCGAFRRVLADAWLTANEDDTSLALWRSPVASMNDLAYGARRGCVSFAVELANGEIPDICGTFPRVHDKARRHRSGAFARPN